MKKLIMVIAVLSMFAAQGASAADMGDMMKVLKIAKQSIDSTLAEVGTDIEAAAKDLAITDLKGDDARKILTGLCKYRPYVVNCSILNADGMKIAVEPDEYREYEGADRSALPYVLNLLKTKKPVMSDVYRSAEGVSAVTIAYPVLSDKGELLGAVRMLIRYEIFLKPLVDDKPFKIWVMQKNGLIVYDTDPEEIGKSIFTDNMFKPFEDLVSFSRTVSLSKSGAGSYSFYADAPSDKTLVEKIAAWDTAGLYGTEWRVIAMEVERTLEEPVLPTATPAPVTK